ncbi:MAG: saccharopine dehydrogenase C-terminal domain-containing protein [Ignavibacteriales bacterium]
MKNITVLGAGMVGSAIARNLSPMYQVTSIDLKKENFNGPGFSDIRTLSLDISEPGPLRRAIKDSDLVIGAVPGFMGFNTLKNVIEEGKDVVDISFFSEDPFLLDNMAKEKGVRAAVDCGVAPGMSNIILGCYASRFNLESYKCMVGGLPFERKLPFQYKAPFSPIDVIEEYTRTCRIVSKGKLVFKEALTEPETVEVARVGTLVAFNTDGLRTLIHTMKVPDMVEKTLRYPGHMEIMKVFRDSGFFNSDYLKIGENEFRPIDLTSHILFPHWRLKEGEKEFTAMIIEMHGEDKGIKKKITSTLFDETDSTNNISSMARTTGYTCCAVAELLLNRDYNTTGIIPPEHIGANENCFEKILHYLKERNVLYNFSESEV